MRKNQIMIKTVPITLFSALFFISGLAIYGIFFGFGVQCEAYFAKPSYEYAYCVHHRKEGTPMYQIIEYLNGATHE